MNALHRRTFLQAADGGRTWSPLRVYADDADATVNTMSPSLVRLKLVHYFRSPMVGRRRELMLTRVPVRWLTEEIS